MPKKKKFKNEGDVKKEVKKLLDAHNWFWWMPAANGFGMTGVSDFCAIRGGVFLAIETKFGKNKPTEMQKGFLTSVSAESCMAFVVNENRLGTLRIWLEAFDRSMEAAARKEEPTHEDGAMLINAMREMQQEFV